MQKLEGLFLTEMKRRRWGSGLKGRLKVKNYSLGIQTQRGGK